MKRKLVMNSRDERSRWAITPEALELLRTSLPDDWELVNVSAHVSSRGDGSGVSPEALAAVRDAEVFIGFGFPRELLQAAQKLRWVHTNAAGVGSLLYPEMLSSDVVLTNSAGIHAPPMAETVIGAALHFARGFDFTVRAQARGQWDQSGFESTDSPVTELQGSTMGIIGMGGIGREVAWRAEALGMRVLATRKVEVNEILSESDVVVIAVPSTPKTRGMISRRELALLKPSAVLINVARGNIVVEKDLIDCLQRGAIRGAALDVFETEPLPADSPLWNLANVLILPHISATTPHYWQREMALILDNFARYLNNQPLRNVVDKNEGY